MSDDYALSDSDLMEVTGSQSQLKVRNYASDENTSALFHFDESSGTTITDSSSNSNNGTAFNISDPADWITGNLNNALSLDGSSKYASVPDSASLSMQQDNTLEAWVKFDSEFSAGSHDKNQPVIDNGSYKVYFDNDTGKLNYELQNTLSVEETRIAGDGENNGWEENSSSNYPVATVYFDGKVYAAISNGGDIWEYDGSSWTQIGGDSLNGSWSSTNHELYVMDSNSNSIFITLRNSGVDQVWEYDGSSWTQIGGDSLNGSWSSSYKYFKAIAADDNNVYVGNSSNLADLWQYSISGETWTRIGYNGDPWTSKEWISSIVIDGSDLYVGASEGSGSQGQVWKYSSSTWTKIGGEGANSSWNSGNYNWIHSLTKIGDVLYAGINKSYNDAYTELWKFESGSWGGALFAGGGTVWNTGDFRNITLTNDGTNLFVGLGGDYGTTNSPRLYKYDESWTQIGGNELNDSWSDFNYGYPNNYAYNGGILYTTLSNNGYIRAYDTSQNSWSIIGGGYYKGSWPLNDINEARTIAYYNENIYVGTGYSRTSEDGQASSLVWKYDGSDWSIIGGSGYYGSWSPGFVNYVSKLYSTKDYLYAGLGGLDGHAGLWRYNGSSWEEMAGDGVGWADDTYEEVSSIFQDGSNLYVGLGHDNYQDPDAGDAEIYMYDGNSWSKIAGDSTNSSWDGSNHAKVYSITKYDDSIFASVGSKTAGDAEVWRFNGSDTWTKVGGDGTGWDDSVYDFASSMYVFGENLYVGVGNDDKDGMLMEYDGSSWTKVGGDGVNSSWSSDEYDMIKDIISYGGEMFVSMGTYDYERNPELWKVAISDGSYNWTQLIEAETFGTDMGSPMYKSISSMTQNDGKLFFTVNDDSNARVYSYGNNKQVSSTNSTWSADTWYHIACSYDKSNLKVYINGSLETTSDTAVLQSSDSTNPLYIGRQLASERSAGIPSFFAGDIDEVRISNTARTEFISSPYATTRQTVQPDNAVLTSGVAAWSGFSASETTPGTSTINYRLSDDGGTTWYYYTGGAWTQSNALTETNSVADINTNISTFPVTTDGILWQAVFYGNGDEQVILSSVTVSYTEDTTDPTNPDTVVAKNVADGETTLTTDNWYNYATPNFTLSGSDDDASGVAGYYVYFGTSDSADPYTAGSYQTSTTYNASNLESGNTYYLLVKTKDNAQNVSDTAANLFTYKYDATVPNNPSFVSVSPSGYTSSNSYTFIWPASGEGVATDPGAPTTGSGLAGYQYKTGATEGDYSDWSNTITETQLELSDPAYQEGTNTFYLRTIDNVGNASTAMSVAYYYAGSAPSAPTNLTVSPASSSENPKEENAFSFDWDEPETYNGSIAQYHYTINILPTNTNTTTTTSSELPSGAYATQQGKNTLYVVAEDEAGNINYDLYASVEFYAQTPAPGAPTALQVFDISNRDNQEYATSLKWSAPTSTGTGFNGYEVFRSTDNKNFESVGTSSSTTYVDTDLESTKYYYYVKSRDNAGQYSTASSSINLIPTGRYTTPPELTEEVSVDPKSFSADFTWETDRESSTFIEFGLDQNSLGEANGGETTGKLDQETDHEIQVKGLDPETIYYYQSVWVDSDGNEGRSETSSFTTDLRPKISNVDITNITLDSATISWETTTVSSSSIQFGKTTAFGGIITDQSGSQTTVHTVNLTDLDHSSKYYFQISGTDVDGNALASDTYNFETLTKPYVENLRFETVEDASTTTLKFSWNTNVPTTSIVNYQISGGNTLSQSDAEYRTEHEIIVSNLADKTTYILQAKGVDEFGNEAVSDLNNFTTPDDTRPPKVSNLSIEIKSSGVGTTQKAQIVASWETDEPAASQVEYGPGISSSSYPSKTAEDGVLKTSHAVIISELEPSKLYHLRAVSKDGSGNQGTSVDTTAITGKLNQSVLDVIVNALERSLGFLTSLFNF